MNKKLALYGLLLLLVPTVAYGLSISTDELKELTGQDLGASVLHVYQGGSGAATFTAGECLVGNGTNPFTTTACGAGGGATDQLGQIGDVSTTSLASGYILLYDGSTWNSAATSSLSIVGHETDYYSATSSAGQQNFVLGYSYAVGDSSLKVFVNGVLMRLNEDYKASSTDTVYFNSGRLDGDFIDVYRFGAITSSGKLTEEEVEDYVGGMVTGNTETNITVTYQDSDGTLDFVASAAGATAWDNITNPDANDEIDFGAFVIELNVENFQVGDGGANFVDFNGTPLMTFNGNADIDLPDDSVDAADINTITCGTNCTWDAANDEIDIDDAFIVNNANDTMVGTLTADGLTLGANENITLGAQTLDHDGTDFVFNDSIKSSGIIYTSIGFDGVGAIDLDYGSVDITDHTFITDGTGDAEIVLPNGSISGTEILDDTIDSADYAAGSIDAEHLAGDVISETKIADNGIDSEHYNDGSIDGVHLAADTITHAYIADADQADTKCIWFEDPTAADDFKSIWANKTANNFLLTEIWGESDQTVSFDLQVDDGSPADVSGTDIAPAAGEAEDTTLAGDTTLAAGEELDLIITSVSGTPTWVSICWTGNWLD